MLDKWGAITKKVLSAITTFGPLVMETFGEELLIKISLLRQVCTSSEVDQGGNILNKVSGRMSLKITEAQ